MNKVFALVDCNNFYTSCEKIFAPALEDKPVIVLSNNDGCVIASSNEAKLLGIKMGVPVFKIPEIIEKNNVHVFSTNYALYGDISQRVMNILAELAPDTEIYSIDEAFLDLSGIPKDELIEFGKKIKETVKQWTGIPVSIGIAPTKTLAKIANHIAKTEVDLHGILNLTDNIKSDYYLKGVPVREIWGVDEKYAQFFQKSKIFTAFDLKQADENRIKEHLGVMGQRLVLELRGTVCYPIDSNPETKKEICTSRSFGQPVTAYEELEQATMSYVSKVAQKLRKQKSLANSILIFIMTNKFAKNPQYVNYKIIQLPVPTNQTAELIHYAVIALKKLYKKGYAYKKSGVIVSDVVSVKGPQTNLWDDVNRDKNKKLLEVIDNINRKAGIEQVKFAVQGTEETWHMRQHHLSPHYTTKWSDILIVDVDEVYKVESKK
jgi:DNA polymerase V